jgi:PAS domain S-box-containing protein
MIAGHAGDSARHSHRALAERWLRDVTESTGDPAAVLDADFRVVLTNEAFAHQLGRTEQELVGLPAEAVTPESELALMQARLRRLAGGEVTEYQAIRSFRRADGSRFRSVVHVRRLGAEAEPIEYIGVRSLKVEAAHLTAAELVDQLTPLFEDAADALAVCTSDGVVRAAWGMQRARLIRAGSLIETIHAADREIVAERLRRRSEYLSFTRVRLTDGTPADLYLAGVAEETDTVVVRLHCPPRAEPHEHAATRLQTALEALDAIAGILWSSGLVELPTAPPNTVRKLPIAGLSDKERKILFAVMRNQQVASIAREMYVSPSTVRNYLSSIYAKFGVRSKLELMELLHSGETAALSEGGASG